MTGCLFKKFGVVIALGCLGRMAHAAPVDGSFESGDFSGRQVAISRGVSQHQPRNRPAGTAPEAINTLKAVSLPRT
jgi:hypothetical protein